MSRNHGYAVIDFETTGVHNQHAIIEIGVVLLRPDLSVEKTWEALVHPQQPISNSRIHGIADEDVAQAPIFEELAPHLKYLLHGRVLVAHNVGFEKRFLRNEFHRAGMRDSVPDSWVDTMTLSSHYLGVKKLSEALAIADIPNPLAHSALSDASATADLLRYLHVEHLAPITGHPTAAFAERSPSATSEDAHTLRRSAANDCGLGIHTAAQGDPPTGEGSQTRSAYAVRRCWPVPVARIGITPSICPGPCGDRTSVDRYLPEEAAGMDCGQPAPHHPDRRGRYRP
ncbi:3'-5' exonuclease [Corynebacterium sp. CCUG 65737]|uniref:3'-5' exonuclease n=1 Tax=Corynebacterium sp. CCUG 65737 TaxID=2823889 RepID=UPI00210BEDF6|nr:3'-5' exonuclease [Corynebacterium sp. CCUG 65737]MCQ4626574.1 3'-5' exonuclease [Corynebacterium sp. CCUG 65737]